MFYHLAKLGVVMMAEKAHQPGLFLGRRSRWPRRRDFSPPDDIFRHLHTSSSSRTTSGAVLDAFVSAHYSGKVGASWSHINGAHGVSGVSLRWR